MSKFTQTLCIVFAFVSLFSNASESRPHPSLHASAPENPTSCDSFKLKMNDCSPYLKNDSSILEPGTSCCSGVMDVWKVDSNCSGEVLKSLVNLQDMNETRVTHVSSACCFMDISLDKYLEASLLGARIISEDKAEIKRISNTMNVAIFVAFLLFMIIFGCGVWTLYEVY